MMKRYILLIIIILQCATLCAQLTIEECYRLARENYPLVKRYGLITSSEQYDLSNALKAYLPQISLSGKATYQTDVTTIPINIPGYEIPTLSKDQYQILAEISQSIWDGGNTKASREVIKSQGEVDRMQFEVDMYSIKERINNLYFGILLIEEQIKLSNLYLQDLQVSRDRVQSYMDNGIANQADIDAISVEQLTVGQNLNQLQANRMAYINMLSAFIGKPLDENINLVKPTVSYLAPDERINNRPELDLYRAMEKQAEAQRLIINASNMPQLGVFLQGGYGKPGLNMFKDNFQAFAIGGVRFSWNFGNFYSKRNNLLKVDNNIRQIEIQRETFVFNNNLKQEQQNSEYLKYIRVMADDDEIIRMRGNIVKASEAKFENGTLSVTDLMRDMIAEQNAKLNKAVHEIELLKTVYEIKNITNN